MHPVTFVLISLIWFVAAPELASAADPVLRLNSAELIVSDSTAPPPDSAPWHAQTLPDDWGVSRPDVSGYAWYRLRFDLPKQPAQPWAVYVPFIGPVGAIYVNDVLLGRTGPFDKTEGQLGDLLLSIPSSVLKSGSNRLDVLLFNPRSADPGVSLLAGVAGELGLSEVFIGEDILVRGEYVRRTLFRTKVGEVHGVFSAILGLFILLLWLHRRREPMYGWFALAALLRAVFSASNFVRVPPIPEPYWAVLTDIASNCSGVAMLFFSLRYGGWRWPRVERGVWLYTLLLVCLTAVKFSGGPLWLRYVVEMSDLPIICGWLAVLAIAGWRHKISEGVIFSTSAIFYAATVAYDRTVTDFAGFSWYAYRGLLLYAAIGWMLVTRFAHSINESEKLSAELEQRVAQKHAELQENYQKMQQMERQAAVAEERSRIMSDMHDGIGGQLISTLSMVEHGEVSSAEVAAALRECIDDLRLTIDSLEPTENDLLPVLGNLRYRLDGRLRTQGISLDWRVHEVPKLACLTPQNVLHILRILQEALTNVLKHAHASLISVETGVDGGNRVFIRVHDNGTGFSGDHKGHGLANMKQRAKIIGGELDIQPSPTGTTLNLLLPVS